jgi:transcriptional regulator with XRE-family HTH domain
MNIHPEDKVFLGKNLKYLRKVFSLSQKEVGELVNKGQTTVGNWENKKSHPSIQELLIISNYFGLPVGDLLMTDVEKSGLVTEEMVLKSGKKKGLKNSNPARKPVRYESPEQNDYIINEQSELSTWVVLKTLRTIEEKIDELKSLLNKKEAG